MYKYVSYKVPTYIKIKSILQPTKFVCIYGDCILFTKYTKVTRT